MVIAGPKGFFRFRGVGTREKVAIQAHSHTGLNLVRLLSFHRERDSA